MADDTISCQACGGAGDLPDRRWLEACVHLILMCGEHGANPRQGLHPWLAGMPLPPSGEPSPAFAELTGNLSGRAPRPAFGHDALDRFAATNAIVKAAGLDDKTWGICQVCKGDGSIPAPHGHFGLG